MQFYLPVFCITVPPHMQHATESANSSVKVLGFKFQVLKVLGFKFKLEGQGVKGYSNVTFK